MALFLWGVVAEEVHCYQGDGAACCDGCAGDGGYEEGIVGCAMVVEVVDIVWDWAAIALAHCMVLETKAPAS